mgnify:CR=1 FL=1
MRPARYGRTDACAARASAADGFRNNYMTDTFPLKLLRKDVGLATALGRELNVPLPLANIAEQKLVAAVNRGLGDQSAYTVTFQLQEEAAQVKLRADGIDPQQAENIFQRTRKRSKRLAPMRPNKLFKRSEPLHRYEVIYGQQRFQSFRQRHAHPRASPISGSVTSIRNLNTARPLAPPIMCGTCALSVQTAAPGAARPIRHLEHFPRRVTFFTRIRNSLKLTTSVAGRHKFSSTPWKKKE